MTAETGLHPRYDEVSSYVPSRGCLRLYYEWAVRKTHAPPSYHALALLPSMAYECNRLGITIGGQPPRILVSLVGPSGSAKSTAASMARKVTRAWQAELQGAEYVDPYLQLSGSLPGVIEALIHRFDTNRAHTRAILTLDEMSQILTHEDFADTLNRLYDGEDYERHIRYIQKEKGEAVLKAPVLGGLFASTPASLQATVTLQQAEGGLFSRILWGVDQILPGELRPTWAPAGNTDTFFTQTVHWLGEMSRWLSVTKMRHQAPLDLRVPDAATQVLIDALWPGVTQRVERNEPGASTWLRAYHAAKDVLVLYALSDGRLEPSADDADRVVKLMQRVLYGTMQLHPTLGVSSLKRKQTLVLDAVLQAGSSGLTLRSVYRRFKLVKAEADAIIAALVDQGLVIRETRVTRGPQTWVVVPTDYAMQVQRTLDLD